MNKIPEDDTLDALFDLARDDQKIPLPETLQARILADAEAVQEEMAPVTVAQTPTTQSKTRYWLAEIKDALGGWGGVTGLCSALVFGVYIGGVNPSLMTGFGLTTAERDYEEALEFGLENAFPDYLSFVEGI